MEKSKKIETIFKVVVLLCLAVISGFLFLLSRKVDRLGFGGPVVKEATTSIPQVNNDMQATDLCGEECKSQISQEVSRAMATLSGVPQKETVYQSAPVSKQNRTTYIPFSGPITSTSTGWIDVVGTDVYIDLEGDYGKGAEASWEAFLKVAHGNGEAFARLYDATHGIGVNGSEVSTKSPTSVQVSSGNISLWAGRNLYRVQLKSLNTFEVTFASGRIRVAY